MPDTGGRLTTGTRVVLVCPPSKLFTGRLLRGLGDSGICRGGGASALGTGDDVSGAG